MDQQHFNRIIIDPAIMAGKPIINGTRITVELILRQLAQGQTVDDILTHYPHITKEDIQSALAYAAQTLEEEIVYPLNLKSHVKAATLA